MFKNTGVELELITDLESYLCIESGGIPLISHRRGHRIFLVISLRTGVFESSCDQEYLIPIANDVFV